MREPNRDKERLQHIVEAANLVIEHSKGLSFEMFVSDKLRYWTQSTGHNGHRNQ